MKELGYYDGKNHRNNNDENKKSWKKTISQNKNIILVRKFERKQCHNINSNEKTDQNNKNYKIEVTNMK